MKRKMIVAITSALFILIGLFAGIRFASADVADEVIVPDPYPRNQTLYITGIQWVTPSNFNPMNGEATWPTGGNHLLVYETLFAKNQLTGDLDPLLAKGYAVSSDSTVITVTLQDGTMWQDDQPLSTDDVVYSFNLAKTYCCTGYDDLYNYISEIKSTGERTLEITLNSATINPGKVKNFLATIKILPKHIWQARESGGNPAFFVETHPIGSGPYSLQNYSPESIILFRDDKYWGKAIFGLPRPRYVIHRIYATNQASIQAFKNGDVDMSQMFISEIWKLREEQGLPIGTWFSEPPYQLAGSIPMLIINTTKPGLDNPLVRRALAYSINYAAISQEVWNISEPVNSSLILPYGGESALFNPTQVTLYGWAYNPAKAEDILVNQLNATKGPDGIYVLPGNTRLGPWSTRCPNNWGDWQLAITKTIEGAQAVGIDLYSDFPDWNNGEYYGDLQTGDFDLAMFWTEGMGPNTPWQRFHDLLEPRGVPMPPASTNWNFGRFYDDTVPPLLDQVAEAEDPLTVKAAYAQLDRIFMENAVGIPMMYRPFEFYEFNTSHWLGFPTVDNPSAPPMFSGAGIEILYKISPGLFYLPVVTR